MFGCQYESDFVSKILNEIKIGGYNPITVITQVFLYMEFIHNIVVERLPLPLPVVSKKLRVPLTHSDLVFTYVITIFR